MFKPSQHTMTGSSSTVSDTPISAPSTTNASQMSDSSPATLNRQRRTIPLAQWKTLTGSASSSHSSPTDSRSSHTRETRQPVARRHFRAAPPVEWFIAAEAGNSRHLEQLLITRRFDINSNYVDPMGNEARPPALIITTEDNHFEAMTVLLSNDAHVAVQNARGQTPLHIAVGHKNAACIDLLIAFNALHDINRQNDRGQTALHMVAMGGNINIAESIINSETAHAINIQDNAGKTALHYAVERRSLEIILLLLAHDANLTLTDSFHRSPLRIAVEQDWTAMMSVLIGFGADINPEKSIHDPGEPDAKTEQNLTLLHMAAKNGSVDAIDILLKAGALASIEAQDGFGRTPLHLAAGKGDVPALNRLIAAGANIHAKDNQGLTATKIAKQNGHYQLVVRLKELRAFHLPVPRYAIVQNTYTTTHPTGLSVTSGQIAVMLKKGKHGWKCEIHEQQGWVPSHLLIEISQSLYLSLQSAHDKIVTMLPPQTTPPVTSSSTYTPRPQTASSRTSPRVQLSPFRASTASSSRHTTYGQRTSRRMTEVSLQRLRDILPQMRQLFAVYDENKGILRRLQGDSPEVMAVRQMYERGQALPSSPYSEAALHWLCDLGQILTETNPPEERESYRVIHGLRQVFPLYTMFHQLTSIFSGHDINIFSYPSVFMHYFLGNYQGWRQFINLFQANRFAKLNQSEISWLLREDPEHFADRLQLINLLKVLGEARLVTELMSGHVNEFISAISADIDLIAIDPTHNEIRQSTLLQEIAKTKPTTRPTRIQDVWHAFLNIKADFSFCSLIKPGHFVDMKLKLHGLFQKSYTSYIYAKLYTIRDNEKLTAIDKIAELYHAGVYLDASIDNALKHDNFLEYLNYLKILIDLRIEDAFSQQGLLTGAMPVELLCTLAKHACLTLPMCHLIVAYIKQHGALSIYSRLKTDHIDALKLMVRYQTYSEHILHAIILDKYPASTVKLCQQSNLLNPITFPLLCDPEKASLFNSIFLHYLSAADKAKLSQGDIAELMPRARFIDLLSAIGYGAHAIAYASGQYAAICGRANLIPRDLLMVPPLQMPTYMHHVQTEITNIQPPIGPIEFQVVWNAYVNVCLMQAWHANKIDTQALLFYKLQSHRIYHIENFDNMFILATKTKNMPLAVDIISTLFDAGLYNSSVLAFALEHMENKDHLPYLLLLKKANAHSFAHLDGLLTRDIPLHLMQSLFDKNCLTQKIHLNISSFVKMKQNLGLRSHINIENIEYFELMHRFDAYSANIFGAIAENAFNHKLANLCKAQGLLNPRMFTLIFDNYLFFNDSWVDRFLSRMSQPIDLRKFNFIEAAYRYQTETTATNDTALVDHLITRYNTSREKVKGALHHMRVRDDDDQFNRSQSAHDPGIDEARKTSCIALFKAYSEAKPTQAVIQKRRTAYLQCLDTITAKELAEYDKEVKLTLALDSAKAAYQMLTNPQTLGDKAWANFDASEGQGISNSRLFHMLVYFCCEPSERYQGVTERNAYISLILMSYKLMRNYNLDAHDRDNGKDASKTCSGGGANIMVNEMSTTFHRIQMVVQNNALAGEYVEICVRQYLRQHLMAMISTFHHETNNEAKDAQLCRIKTLLNQLQKDGVVGATWEAIRPLVENDMTKKFFALFGEYIRVRTRAHGVKTGPEQLAILLSGTVEWSNIDSVLSDCELALNISPQLSPAPSSSSYASSSSSTSFSDSQRGTYFFASSNYGSTSGTTYGSSRFSKPPLGPSTSGVTFPRTHSIF